MPSSVDTNAVLAQAQTERQEEVKKELVKKYKVIAKRRGQLAANTAGFEAKVKAFDDAVASSESPEAIMAAIETHKFPECSTGLSG
jgi:hypothetical protein